MRKHFLFCAALTAAITLVSGFSMTAAAERDRWSSTTSRDSEGNICIDFEEVQVLLPNSWSGKCQMSTSETGVSFCQIKSRELWTEELGYPNGGWLFSIECSDNFDFLDFPSYMTIGNGAEGIYYATFPTDFQAYADDDAATSEYMEMYADIDWISEHITLTASGESTAIDGDYIFPESSSAYLSESDLSGLDSGQVQMAINEIYARHHRKFILESVQDYFNSKSWYSGYIEADDFDATVMNQYEGANIDLMVTYLNNMTAAGQESAAQQPSTSDAYGMIIESGDGYLRVRQEDGSVVQVWYEASTLTEKGVSRDALQVGAITSLIYDDTSYEVLSILIW